MPKLNVEVLDMVNGEITKIAYDDAEYAKVGGISSDIITEGDIAYVKTSRTAYFDAKSFYEFIEQSDNGNYMFKDNYGHRTGISNFNERTVVFRKISAPTLEERVTDLETEVAALKSGDSSLKGEKVEAEKLAAIKEGDEVTINFAVWKKHGVLVDLTEGKRYKVIERRDGLNIIDDAGDERNLFVDEPEVVNVVKSQANETIEFEGATYRKVDREAREGDVVISNAKSTRIVTKGKPYKVSKCCGDLTLKEGTNDVVSLYNAGRTRETVDVYEAKYIPEVGDIVVVTGNTNYSCNAIGEVEKIIEGPTRSGGYRVQVEGRDTCGNISRPNEIRKATPAEVEAYEKAAHKASFAVGDYVKVVKSYAGNEGAILRITGIGDYRTGRGPCEFKLEALTGKTVGDESGATADQIVKATDAEIAKATAPKLKAGDFVKWTDGSHSLPNGETFEVFKDCDGDLYVVDNDGDKRWSVLDSAAYKYEIVDVETAKWAKLGRKVNEFKEGDIVRVTKSHNGHPVGTIGKLVPAPEYIGTDLGVLANGHKKSHISGMELIAPVESTLN